MTNLSNIITDSNVLTDNNTQTVTNKTISGSSNTVTNLDASQLSSGTVPTARLASGTADSTTFLRGDQTWAAAGLTYFADAESTTSPNDTVYVDSLTVQGSSTNVDVALVAKGTGATLAQIPDGTTTGGNKRGVRATDWQKYRSAAEDVAAAAYSTISGGNSNRISSNNGTSTIAGGSDNDIISGNTGSHSIISGGYSNEISANTSPYAIISGGYQNHISGNSAWNAIIAGGSSNNISATTGSYSVISGGSNNTIDGASSTYSTIGGGDSNTISNADYALAIGSSHTVSNDYSVALCRQNSITSQAAFAGGYFNTVSGNYAAAFGYGHTVSGTYSTSFGNGATNDADYTTTFGRNVDAKNKRSSIILGVVPPSGATGSTHTGIMTLGNNTSDATPTKLANDGSNTYLCHVRMDTNSSYAFKIIVAARSSSGAGGDTKAWELLGCIKKGATNATTALLGSVTKTVIAADTSASSWDCDIAVDTTYGVWTVEVTGAASTNIRWTASVYTTEVDY